MLRPQTLGLSTFLLLPTVFVPTNSTLLILHSFSQSLFLFLTLRSLAQATFILLYGFTTAVLPDFPHFSSCFLPPHNSFCMPYSGWPFFKRKFQHIYLSKKFFCSCFTMTVTFKKVNCKDKQMRFHQTKKLLHSIANSHHNKKTNFGTAENICKSCI